MDHTEQAVQEIFRVFMAEHWARFYFAVQQDDVVFLDVPREALAQTEADAPELAEFVKGINGQPIDMASSRRVVAEFVFRTLEGGKYPVGTVTKAFDSRPFALVMRLFSVWLSGHEEMLDANPLPVAEWERLFNAWRQDPAVARFAANLTNAGNPSAPASGSVH